RHQQKGKRSGPLPPPFSPGKRTGYRQHEAKPPEGDRQRRSGREPDDGAGVRGRENRDDQHQEGRHRRVKITETGPVALPPARRLVRIILEELRGKRSATESKPWVRLDGDVAASGASQARRDPLRPEGPGHATAAGGLAAQALLGPVTLLAHPYFDTRLKFDPDYHGKKDRFVAGR